MITKTQFTKEMAQRGNLNKQEAERLFDLFLDTLKHCIKEYGGVKFRGFGNFVVKEHKERMGRNRKMEIQQLYQNIRLLSFMSEKYLKIV